MVCCNFKHPDIWPSAVGTEIMQPAWLNFVESSFPTFFHRIYFISICNILFPPKISRHAIYTALKGIFRSSVMFLPFCSNISFCFWSMLMSAQTEARTTFLLVIFEGFFSVSSFYQSRELQMITQNNSSFMLGKRSLPLTTQFLANSVSFASGYYRRLKFSKFGDPKLLSRHFHSVTYFSKSCFHF